MNPRDPASDSFSGRARGEYGADARKNRAGDADGAGHGRGQRAGMRDSGFMADILGASYQDDSAGESESACDAREVEGETEDTR